MKRTFEGLGYVSGDYADAAAACIWMETHGLNGLALVSDTWSQLSDGSRPISPISRSGSETIVLDANNTSLLTCGHKVIELALAGALTRPSQQIELRHCHSRLAVTASLATIGRFGASALAYWYKDESNYCVALLHGEKLPRVARNKSAQMNSRESESLTLVCSLDPDIVEKALQSLGFTNEHANIIFTPDRMTQCYEDNLEHGLQIKPEIWTQLNVTADRVLVRATEQSRRGAGA